MNLMRVPLMLLLCVSVAVPQTGASHTTSGPGSTAVIDWKTAARLRGTEALRREKERRKSDRCSQAVVLGGGIASIDACLQIENKASGEDYLAYIRAVGALLRGTPSPKQGGIPFDAGEAAWQKYRDQGCSSVASQYEGGDQEPIAYGSCRLTLTMNHMDELVELYSDLWH
jgi:hypothetical protein